MEGRRVAARRRQGNEPPAQRLISNDCIQVSFSQVSSRILPPEARFLAKKQHQARPIALPYRSACEARMRQRGVTAFWSISRLFAFSTGGAALSVALPFITTGVAFAIFTVAALLRWRVRITAATTASSTQSAPTAPAAAPPTAARWSGCCCGGNHLAAHAGARTQAALAAEPRHGELLTRDAGERRIAHDANGRSVRRRSVDPAEKPSSRPLRAGKQHTVADEAATIRRPA